MSIISDAFASAGVQLNGPHPWDPQIHHPGFEARVLAQGSLGLGEAYMDGWWDCEQLDEFFVRIIVADLGSRVPKNFQTILALLKATFVNMQSKRRAFEIAKVHYDLGNDLYRAMLDKRMTYSCGYWKDAKTLDEAQEAKLDLICRKLQLKPGQRVLDIGCGWGSFALFAAEKYGVSVTGVTVSKEQAEYVRTQGKHLPIDVLLQDYRDTEGTFDRVVSVGMFEHVGPKNYETFLNVAHRCLKDDGLFLLHSIGGSSKAAKPDPWIDTYIFPGGTVPLGSQLMQLCEGRFVLEDWHNFGSYYDPTLMAWEKNFREAWPSLQHRFDERFYRMWRYYLLVCAASFRTRSNQLWQVVLSTKGVKGGYASIR